MTVNEALMLAAVRLHEAGHVTFSPEQLAVAAWEGDRQRFGLKGFPHHPDSHKILYSLSGPRGLVTLRKLNRLGPRCYQLARLPGKRVEPAPFPELPEAVRAWFLSRIDDPLTQRVAAGETERLAWGEACWWWGRDHHTAGLWLTKLAAAFADGRECVLPSGRAVGRADVERLQAVDATLRRVFKGKIRRGAA